MWKFTANSNGTYRITNAARGLVLIDPRGNKASGTTLVQVPSDSDSDAEWIVTPLNKGFRITNVASQLAMATSDTPAPATSIIQATPTGNSSQVWVVR